MPSEDEVSCANGSEAWAVSLVDQAVRIQAFKEALRGEPLPFSFAPRTYDERIGEHHVLRVADGWVVGFDGGEWGGGLWWFSKDGAHSIPLRPPADSPVNPDDPFQAENVRGFTTIDGTTLVFMGLDHLTGRSGRVFRLDLTGNVWTLRPFAVLDSSPCAWWPEHEVVFVLTSEGLWWADGRSTRQLSKLELGGLYPNSMVRTSDGSFYAGLRGYLVRWNPSGDAWHATWLAPSNCVHVKLHPDGFCECMP